MEERRLVRVDASLEFWQEIITTGWSVPHDGVLKIVCEDGLPEGARLVRMEYKNMPGVPLEKTGILVFIFYHDSFDKVENGAEIPFVTPTFKEYYED